MTAQRSCSTCAKQMRCLEWQVYEVTNGTEVVLDVHSAMDRMVGSRRGTVSIQVVVFITGCGGESTWASQEERRQAKDYWHLSTSQRITRR